MGVVQSMVVISDCSNHLTTTTGIQEHLVVARRSGPLTSIHSKQEFAKSKQVVSDGENNKCLFYKQYYCMGMKKS